MLKSSLILCAIGVVIDSRSNNVSVFNILEEISPVNFPAFLPEVAVLNFLERDSLDDQSIVNLTLRLSIGGESLFQQVLSVNFQDKLRNRTVINIGGLPIPRPGKLDFSIIIDDVVLDQYEIVVHPAPTTAVATSSAS